MRIFIEPAEPLMFRSGRPFTAGEHTFAESLFPPTPETLQGAVRALLAVRWGAQQHPPLDHLSAIFQQDELVKLIGRRTEQGHTYGRFRVSGLALGWRDPHTGRITRLFPAPAHLICVRVKDESGQVSERFLSLAPTGLQTGERTNLPLECSLVLLPGSVPGTINEKTGPLPGWLTTRGLRAVLRGDTLPEGMAYLHRSRQIYNQEPRLGIGVDNATKTTREGYLYQVLMIRMQPGYGFVVDVAFGEAGNGEKATAVRESLEEQPQALAFLQEGWMTLGGEQRAARFTVLQADDLDREEQAGISSAGRANLVYFATPACFKDGWLPQAPDIFPAHPVTAAVNRYQPIGG
ncbi:MAG TPA: type III-B CRISPR module-associated protein Cmr3, partial [Ktedonobacteraceae bacterium]